MNRFVWDVRHQAGLAVPPGSYQVRLKVASDCPDTAVHRPHRPAHRGRRRHRGGSEGAVRAQPAHARACWPRSTSSSRACATPRAKLRNATGADAENAKQIEAIAAKLLTEPVRYGKPGLQAHIIYLSGGLTTTADQKIGRDAMERYNVLRKELDAIRADLERLLGSMSANGFY